MSCGWLISSVVAYNSHSQFSKSSPWPRRAEKFNRVNVIGDFKYLLDPSKADRFDTGNVRAATQLTRR